MNNSRLSKAITLRMPFLCGLLSLLACLLPSYRAQAQCNPYSADWSVCQGDTIAVPIPFSLPGQQTRYSYHWTHNINIELISGQGTREARVIPRGGSVTVLHGQQYDSLLNCTTQHYFALYNSPALQGILTFDTVPSCPTNGQIDTLAFSYPNSFTPYATWTVNGGTLLNMLRRAGSFTYDTLVVQWNGSGNPEIIGIETQPLTGGFGPASYCSYENRFVPPAANVQITGMEHGCGPLQTASYTVPFGAGHSITWSITNGTILSGQGTDSVTVQWTGNGNITVTKTNLACGTTHTNSLAFSMVNMNFSLGNDTLLCQGDTITLFGPGNASNMAWSTGTNWSAIAVGQSGTYWLQATSTYGCTFRDSIDILVDTACVWPGDANYDGFANNIDALTLAANMNLSGPARTNASLSWAGQPAADWSVASPGPVNEKHSDCDGNGQVQLADTLAIYQNYGLSHSKAHEIATVNLSVSPVHDTVLPGNIAWFVINLGDQQNPVTDFKGIAFDLDYSGTGVAAPGLLALDTSNCAFDAQTSLLRFCHHPNPMGTAGIAIARLQGTASGSGELARFGIATNPNGSSSYEPIEVSISNVVVMGQGFSLETGTNASSQNVVGTPVLASQDAYAALQMRIHPQPAKDWLEINIPGHSGFEVSLIDLQGREILASQKSNGPSLRMDVGGLAAGTYFAKLSNGKRQNFARVVIAQ